MTGVLLQALATLAILSLVCTAPGLLLLRRVRLSPAERLGSAVGVSLVVLYVLQGAAFLLGAPRVGALAILALAILAAGAVARDARALLRRARARRGALAFVAALAWSLVLGACIRHYGGSDEWAGDWYEHYQRSLFFLGQLPWDTQFIARYWLPARPPLMNVAASQPLALVGNGYPVFQVACAFLSALAVLACWVLAPHLAPRARPRAALLTAVLATAPTVLQNITYTWTKLLAVFFLLVGVALYVRAWRKDDPARMALAVVHLAAGCLVHYSVGPFALVLGLHYAVETVRRRRWAWREWLALTGTSALLFATWFVPALVVYGASITFGSNTSAAGATGPLIALAHLQRTVVPFPLFDPAPPVPQTYLPGLVSDYAFTLYQSCLPLMLGSAGGLLLGVSLLRGRRSAPHPHAPGPRFWVTLLGLGGLIAVGTVPLPIFPVGVGHVVLQPVVLVGLTALAVALPRAPAWLFAVFVASRALDVALGIVSHALLQSLFVTVRMAPQGGVVTDDPWGLSVRALYNCMIKAEDMLNVVYAGDLLAPALPALRVLVVTGAAAWLVVLVVSQRRARG